MLRDWLPGEPAPHLHLSRVFAELGNPAQAEVASQNFARLQPLQESVKQFGKKVVLFPDSTRAHAYWDWRALSKVVKRKLLCTLRRRFA